MTDPADTADPTTATATTTATTPGRPLPGTGPLIDWPTALATAARLAPVRHRLAAVAAQVETEVPVFRNREFPLSPLPVFLSGPQAARTGRALEAYVRLLEKVDRLYTVDAEVRRWYGLGPAAEALIAAEPRADILVCRLDGYLEQGSERLRILENNADAPAGTLFTPRIHTAVSTLLARAGVELPAHEPGTRPADTALLDVLATARADAPGREDTLCVAVLQPRGRANRESREMVELFRGLGTDAVLADPREVTAVAGHARVGRRRVDVCWNKINTVLWDQLVRADPELLGQWLRVLRDTDLVHVNPFAARYVAENKLTLALLQAPRFADRFEPAERRLAAELLPWSRRLGDGDPESAPGPVLDRQAHLVLKQPFDIRGDGVTVGRAVSRTAWAEAVAGAAGSPAIVQAHVPPSSYPVIRTEQLPDTPGVVAMPTSLDTYVLRGTAAFFGSKASLNPRVNVFQGGQKLAVHVTSTAPEETGGTG